MREGHGSLVFLGGIVLNHHDYWVKSLKKREEKNSSIEDSTSPEDFWYTDANFFSLEREAVFKNSWQYAGRCDQLKTTGDYISGDIFGLPYFVVVDEESEYRAFYNICSHHATCLVEGEGQASDFKCPYHGWTYSLKGELKKIPQGGSLRKIDLKNLGLKEIKLQCAGPFLFLCFEETLNDDFYEIKKNIFDSSYHEFKFVKQVKYQLKCNWKVFVDNYLDGGYHVPHMHPGLTEQLNVSTYKTTLFDSFSVQQCQSQDSGKERTEYTDFLERVEGDLNYFWLYPNFMVNLYGRWMDTNWVRPIKVDECEVIFNYFYRGDLTQELKEKSLRASDKVQEEDTFICEKVQKGLASGSFRPGPYVPHFEKAMFNFHQKLTSIYLNFLTG